MRVRLRSMFVLLVIGAAAAVTFAQGVAPRSSVTLTVDGRSNSTPWIASHGRHVAVSWSASTAGKSDIFVATSTDEGATFSPPVQVNAVVGEARINGEIAPRVALHVRPGATAPEVVVVWNAKDHGTEIKIARSVDGGRTFAAPVSLQAAGAAGDRGWHSLSIDEQGLAHVFWLDHRELATAKSEARHAEHDGVAMAQKSRLYYATYGARASAERALAPGVCFCCKSAVVSLPGGGLVSAWRHVYADNMRDMAFAVSRDFGRTFAAPARVSADGWSINGCPDDGPALAAGSDTRVHIVWPTVIPGAEPVGAIFYSALTESGSFTPRTRIPTLGSPKPSHPQIVVDGAGRLVVAWDESLAGVRTAAYSVAERAPDGTMRFSAPTKFAADGGPTLYPVMARVGHGVVAAWTAGAPGSQVVRVQRLDATTSTSNGAR